MATESLSMQEAQVINIDLFGKISATCPHNMLQYSIDTDTTRRRAIQDLQLVGQI